MVHYYATTAFDDGDSYEEEIEVEDIMEALAYLDEEMTCLDVRSSTLLTPFPMRE